LLRKIYVSYGYLMYSSDRMKDLAFAKYVLAHKSLGVSLTYTALLVQMSIRPTVTFDREVSRQVADLQSQLNQVKKEIQMMEKEESKSTDVFDDLGFNDENPTSVTKLPLKKFSLEQKKRGEDVERVMEQLRTWPQKGIRLSKSNMAKLGIGQTLILKVRNLKEFKNLNLKQNPNLGSKYKHS